MNLKPAFPSLFSDHLRVFTPGPLRSLLAGLLLLLPTTPLFPAASPATNSASSSAELLKGVKVPEGFDLTLFAAAPAVNYPVFVAASADGTVYVSSDKNGSLDRKPDRGRILRARDTDNDGKSDEVKVFVPNVDSPRGLVWDHDRLYVLHPPHLSAFIDHDGDGISDEEKVLVKNIAFTFKDRPADHTSNGIELGVDGWIYCAIGDFGFLEAEGTDGRKLQLRGGGVVRVRPDGTALELYSSGTRNILEAAVSPLLDAFARDNTNDGGGWDIRLHHFTGLSDHGYPSLFKNFSNEIVQPLADYGGGSGCGALFLSEPGFPAGYNDAVYTADWGRDHVYRHELTPRGATYKASQAEFVTLTRATDLDVDASSHLYISSWKGATFNYAGEDVGFLIRVTPTNYRAEPLPDYEHLDTDSLIKELGSPSHRRRLEAQRTLLRKPDLAAALPAIEAFAADANHPLAGRIAALFLLKQKWHQRSHPFLQTLATDPTIAAWAIRALADRTDETANLTSKPFLTALESGDPRVRREAAFASTRLTQPALAPAVAKLLGDPDTIVAHTAVQALKRLGAAETCFAIVDREESSTVEKERALQVLQSLHQSQVVDGLISRLNGSPDSVRQHGLFTALCRLYFTAGPWKGNSWGTRPDTSGPYYQPEPWAETSKIAAALREVLTQVSDPVAVRLVPELGRHKITSDELLGAVVTLTKRNPALLPSALEQLANAERIPSEAVPLLTSAASQAATSDENRANAISALARAGQPGLYSAMLKALGLWPKSHREGRDFQKARDAFLNSNGADTNRPLLERTAADLQNPAAVWADAALLRLSERKDASGETKQAVTKTLNDGWAQPPRRAQILQAVALSEHRSYREKVLTATEDSDAAVSGAAREAARVLRLDRRRNSVPKAVTNPLVETLKPEEVVAAIKERKGDLQLGEQIFTRQGCVMCHTVSADQPLRGPFLGNIATIYKRTELAEAILLPNKTIAQGFASHHFELKDGNEHDGFVIQEAATKVIIRNIAAQEIEIPLAQIVSRTKTERSLMPEGLAANLTVEEFASLLDYLEGLAKK